MVKAVICAKWGMQICSLIKMKLMADRVWKKLKRWEERKRTDGKAVDRKGLSNRLQR